MEQLCSLGDERMYEKSINGEVQKPVKNEPQDTTPLDKNITNHRWQSSSRVDEPAICDESECHRF
jgi:hypothetical protein